MLPNAKKLSRNALNHLLHLFNISWKKGNVPENWRHAVVVAILKNGKDSFGPKSYSLISLTSHTGKVSETMVVRRLRWFLKSTASLICHSPAFTRNAVPSTICYNSTTQPMNLLLTSGHLQHYFRILNEYMT